MYGYTPGKVSMVMPCYNKVDYIGEMFDSILAQKWDAIELILVNDGSTDGTREVMARYKPQFLARGYEVIIIDQENKGVCAAAQAGLRRITGDYVCLVDADDELDPAYCSTMAAWLDAHDDYDYCVCHRMSYAKTEKGKQYVDYSIGDFERDDPQLLEKYLLWTICRVVWIYFLRRSYFEQCHITEHYETSTKGSHEPGYIIPVLANKGKYHLVEQNLYRFNNGRSDGHSDFNTYEKTRVFFEDYEKLCVHAISMSDCLDEEKKGQLFFLSTLSRKISEYLYLSPLCEDESERTRFFKAVVAWLAARGPVMPYELIRQYGEMNYISALTHTLIHGDEMPMEQMPMARKRCRRVIAYGVLGKHGRQFAPLFNYTDMQITDRWDAKGDGVNADCPDFSSLTADDCLLIFPKRAAVLEEVKSKAKEATIWDYDKIKWFLFGQLSMLQHS